MRLHDSFKKPEMNTVTNMVRSLLFILASLSVPRAQAERM